jgi:5'-nucleotidase / UDP-sugar diphosphatase
MKRLYLLLACLLLLVVPASAAQGRQTALRILYLNDFHGFAEPHRPLGSKEMLGGVAYLAGAADRLRREKPALLLAAGDLLQGNNWGNLFQGRSVMEVMNAMRFDAMVVGNHEFDFGPEVLKERIAAATFPVLGANVEGFPGLKPYVIKDFQGLKIALIGVVTPDTPVSTHPRNVVGLKFLSPEETVARYLKEVQGKADLVVVLSHLGFQADRLLAQKVPGIDIIVGGHSHTKILQPEVIGHTLVVQAWEHAKALGVLDLTVADGKITGFKGRLEEIKPSTNKPDPAIQQIVVAYAAKMDARLQETVGEAETALDGENVRFKETNLGDLIADIMRTAAGADAAIINGGSIRAGINRGPIKVRDVYDALPFDNYLVAIRLTGKQIREALEHGVARLEGHGGGFPQVSGLTFTYRRSAPVGSRIQELTVGGQPIGPDKLYVVATNDFLAAGGDGYRVFGEALRAGGDYPTVGGVLKSANLAYSNPGIWVRELVLTYIREKKKVSAAIDGRSRELP